MAGAQRVADQDLAPDDPDLIAKQREIAPHRLVRFERMAAEVRREHPLAVGPAARVAHPVEPSALPGRRVAFHQESAHRRAVAVVMRHERTMLALPERERQAFEPLAGAVPGELVGQDLGFWTKLFLVKITDEGIKPVGPDDPVMAPQLVPRMQRLVEKQLRARALALLL